MKEPFKKASPKIDYLEEIYQAKVRIAEAHAIMAQRNLSNVEGETKTMNDEFVCQDCGYTIHTDLLPFKSLTVICPKCKGESFKAKEG